MTQQTTSPRISAAQVRLVFARCRALELDPAKALPRVLAEFGLPDLVDVRMDNLDGFLDALTRHAETAAHETDPGPAGPPPGLSPFDSRWQTRWYTPATMWLCVKPHLGFQDPDDYAAAARDFVSRIHAGARDGFWDFRQFLLEAIKESSIPERVRHHMRPYLYSGGA